MAEPVLQDAASQVTLVPREPPPRWVIVLFRLALSGLAVLCAVLLHGFRQTPVDEESLRLVQFVALAGLWIDVGLRARWAEPVWPRQRPSRVDAIVPAVGLLGALVWVISRNEWGWRVVEAAAVAALMGELWRVNVHLSRTLTKPGLLLPGSFVLLILACTILLKTPVATPPDRPISWLDALFTATSAVCVTGLTVRSTAEGFTPFGHAVIGVFILLGGLGIIMFGSTLAMLLGQRFSFRENATLSQMLSDRPVHQLRAFSLLVVGGTLSIVLVGAILMMPLWGSAGEPLTLGDRVTLSLFHSVSAFCNAGFDITGDSMVPYRGTFLADGIIAGLAVIGSIGFPVIDNLMRVLYFKVRWWWFPAGRQALALRVPLADRRFSLHTRLVLVTTAALYAYGVICITTAQLASDPRPHRGHHVVEAVLDGHFMSICARTAGFNTIPMDELSPAGTVTIMTLMAVGGSPGGTAGGFKTTVLAVLVLSVISTLRQRQETEVFGRTLSHIIVRQAATLALCYGVLITVSTLGLAATERKIPLDVLLFESISAATTTGLSLGATTELSPVGRLNIILTMFLGRIGPLALLGALILRPNIQRPYAYPHEDPALG